MFNHKQYKAYKTIHKYQQYKASIKTIYKHQKYKASKTIYKAILMEAMDT